MFSKLLLPIDPSKRLKPSRDYAIALAKRLDVPLTAIFVSNPSKTGTVTASAETSKGFEALGKRQLDQFVENIKDIKIIPILKAGKRRKVLAKMVNEGIADTLILGPFRSVISRIFTGSEVERILDSESSHAFVVREDHPLPGPGSPALVVFDGPELPDQALTLVEDFARKFGCDIEFLHLGTEIFGGAEAIDGAVSELRTRLGGDFHITSTIMPLSFFRTRKTIVNSVSRQEGARIVILPDVEDAVSDILLHQLVLSAVVPVCVLR
ncbi:MAG: universal stress protein [Candidatus Thermoplasmatota archaeon]|jgi:nucleotide-binding universal stress UspA family protein|nr:universal stress protein [Candidatus Thermoplasmatota archaeon]MEC9332808.1 universal stress protein [Candidatus Thermoplasmatota archaeon]